MKKFLINASLGLSLGACLGLAYLAKKTEFFKSDKKLYNEFDSTLS
ncbi:hypothetical protein [Streptococcus sobrinus]|nr:hypothetical protein [Streptococcus sobrinus]